MSTSDIRRVAHFTDTYLPRRDGVVASLRTLIAAQHAQGRASLIVTPSHPTRTDPPEILALGSIPSGTAALRLAGWPTARQILRVAAWRPDLIHVHTPGPAGLLGVLAARRLGLPLVHTYHTDLHSYMDAYRVPGTALDLAISAYSRALSLPRPRLETLARSRRHARLDALNRLLLGDADAVIVPTAAVLGRANLPVPAGRIFLVPVAVVTPALAPDAASEFRAQHALAATDRVVLFVGRVNAEKGIELLLPSFARVASRVPIAKLVMIGAIYRQRWLRRLIARHGLRDRVVVTGQLPPDQVAAAYAGAEVFAFPSRTDTQGLVLQEAALAGVPSVLADPALHRAAPIGRASLLAEASPDAFADAVSGLLTDPGMARRLGAAARDLALRHTPGQYAGDVQEVYRRAGKILKPDVELRELQSTPG